MNAKQKEEREESRRQRLYRAAEQVTDEQELELRSLLLKQGEAVVQLVEKQGKEWQARVDDVYCESLT